MIFEAGPSRLCVPRCIQRAGDIFDYDSELRRLLVPYSISPVIMSFHVLYSDITLSPGIRELEHLRWPRVTGSKLRGYDVRRSRFAEIQDLIESIFGKLANVCLVGSVSSEATGAEILGGLGFEGFFVNLSLQRD